MRYDSVNQYDLDYLKDGLRRQSERIDAHWREYYEWKRDHVHEQFDSLHELQDRVAELEQAVARLLMAAKESTDPET